MQLSKPGGKKPEKIFLFQVKQKSNSLWLFPAKENLKKEEIFLLETFSY